MSNVTFDLQWKEAMVELLDELELLDPMSSLTAQEMMVTQDNVEKFQHYSTMYIRYLQVFRKLEESYDQMVHPQKRMDIKKALEAVMGRLLEVKELLIDLNKQVVFINLDDVLVDLKLAPDVLEVPVPRFFIEDQARALEEREKLLDVLLMQAGLSDSKRNARDPREDLMTLESALRVVQLNERGRQGRQRAKFMKEIRMQEERERRLLAQGGDEREPELSAVLIQQNYRGFISRKKTNQMRAEELIFIGMAPPPAKSKEEDPLVKEAEVKIRRKRIQVVWLLRAYPHPLALSPSSPSLATASPPFVPHHRHVFSSHPPLVSQAQYEDDYRKSLVDLDREVRRRDGVLQGGGIVARLPSGCAGIRFEWRTSAGIPIAGVRHGGSRHEGGDDGPASRLVHQVPRA